jgi:hypothetical protein
VYPTIYLAVDELVAKDGEEIRTQHMSKVIPIIPEPTDVGQQLRPPSTPDLAERRCGVENRTGPDWPYRRQDCLLREGVCKDFHDVAKEFKRHGCISVNTENTDYMNWGLGISHMESSGFSGLKGEFLPLEMDPRTLMELQLQANRGDLKSFVNCSAREGTNGTSTSPSPELPFCTCKRPVETYWDQSIHCVRCTVSKFNWSYYKANAQIAVRSFREFDSNLTDCELGERIGPSMNALVPRVLVLTTQESLTEPPMPPDISKDLGGNKVDTDTGMHQPLPASIAFGLASGSSESFMLAPGKDNIHNAPGPTLPMNEQDSKLKAKPLNSDTQSRQVQVPLEAEVALVFKNPGSSTMTIVLGASSTVFSGPVATFAGHEFRMQDDETLLVDSRSAYGFKPVFPMETAAGSSSANSKPGCNTSDSRSRNSSLVVQTSGTQEKLILTWLGKAFSALAILVVAL